MLRSLFGPLLLVPAAVLLAGAAPAQQLTVGSGATLSLGNAAVDLGCSDLVVAGTANLDSAAVTRALSVSIPGGGTLNGGSGSLEITGNWSRTGTFGAGSGEVAFRDGCGTASSTISGSSSFHDLVLSTTAGKQVNFEAGATTTVNGMFDASGAAGNLLEIRSTVDGSEAFLALAAADMGAFVDVKDNHAIPSPVELGPGSLLSGNNTGWSLAALVPGLGPLGLGLLAATLYATGRRRAPR